jgi:hypothetical protein
MTDKTDNDPQDGDERARFEAWHNDFYGPQDYYNPIRSLGYDTGDVGMGYDDPTVQAQFCAFQGALKQAALASNKAAAEQSAGYKMVPAELADSIIDLILGVDKDIGHLRASIRGTYRDAVASNKAAAVAVGEPKQPCMHVDNPKGCYRVRCQLGNKCADDEMSIRAKAAPAPIASPQGVYAWLFDSEEEGRYWYPASQFQPLGTPVYLHPAAAQPSRAED